MNISKVLKEQAKKIKPEKEVEEKIKKVSQDFIKDLNKKLKNKKIKAEVFIGGSSARDTFVKTDENKYDIDIFVRFDKKYKSDKISGILYKILGKKFKKIHGSRDYYQLIVDNIIIEIIPVIKIKNPEDAKNITDLSYFHVNYVLKNIKKKKALSDEIRIGKAFSHAQNCYGAESYIRGFSGYAIELLTIHYGSFLKFIKEVANKDINKIPKLIIDDKKFYKKNEVLRELNESKIQSPIILIDPTYKERNALSGLSIETYNKFKKSCIDFLNNPSEEFFRKRNIMEGFKDFKSLKIISIKTDKQQGDIAGTKSKKFFNFFISKIAREFEVKKADFDYKEEDNIAYYYLVLDKKAEETIKGPPIVRVDNFVNFKKIHPNSFIKGDIAYAKINHELSFEDFLKKFLTKDKKIIDEMSIKEIKLVK
jgi:tRNA nucleotidyltransferase (CCA-adding enzyme)